MKLFIILAILFLYFSSHTCAQEKNFDKTGSIKGIVRDSLYNRTLNSATISIYKGSNDKLLTYQVSNNLGEFAVKNLPLSEDLKMIISNIGYNQIARKFKINTSTKLIDFKIIYASLATTQLEDVNVTIPPMQMNGDTLEFNSAAFKLDTNAVVQDLMKKIPNITMWGDGKITLNGREIKSLLVNGKQFMGGGAKIAIENIPKNALDKIQIYNTVKDPRNLLDTILNMNLKLKKGKDFGYFGKIGGGYGTRNSYETDLNLNIFSPKLQLSLVGASNNINKIANDINTLQRNSTFKGVGVQVDYMPDFRTAGQNQPNSAGYAFRYDFSDKVAQRDNTSMLFSEFFLNNNRIKQESDKQTTTAISGSGNIVEQNINSGDQIYTNQHYNSGFNFSKDRFAFNISQNMDIMNNKSNNNSQSISSDENQQVVSQSYNLNRNESINKSYGLKLDLSYGPRSIIGKSRFSGLSVSYFFKLDNDNSNDENLTNFESNVDPKKNQIYNRLYYTTSKKNNQKINFNLSNITTLIFGVNNFNFFDVDVINDLEINTKNSDTKVFDQGKTINQLIPNTYLTNKTEYNSVIYEPIFKFQKNIFRNLSNRFDKNWSLYFNLRSQFYYQNNRSEKTFQSINRIYNNFLPAAGISFSNSQYGEYKSNITIGYETSTVIPSIEQLAPLTDSANVYFLPTINLNLREEKIQALALGFNRSNEKKNNFDYNFIIKFSKTRNNIIDSILLDKQNVRTVYKINKNNNSLLTLTGALNKAIKFKNSEVQLSYNTNYTYSQVPNIVNNIVQDLATNYFKNTIRFNFTYQSNLAIEAEENIINIFVKQSSELNDHFKNSILSSSFSASYNITKKLAFNSNISLSTSMSTGLKAINYNIWNASTTYRLLRGNNLEMKFSALDILHQNTSVINMNSGGTITLGRQNVLQQYFLFGISYYPRKFGKDEIN
ncbi:hypothetical protein [Pedobacter sp. CFBP9032]|uniref:hypothetical protein n=1 Tax=Pedobacter sp. CFBP9032 TaxID=3096539 RepID=UPI002A6B683A|nr:hypothetical protein [Pedobacter sp. CFBP9032]MDY0905933.1 hypothetical protein [Pedobacter sp. CFBP9032]